MKIAKKTREQRIMDAINELQCAMQMEEADIRIMMPLFMSKDDPGLVTFKTAFRKFKATYEKLIGRVAKVELVLP